MEGRTFLSFIRERRQTPSVAAWHLDGPERLSRLDRTNPEEICQQPFARNGQIDEFRMGASTDVAAIGWCAVSA